MNAWARSHLDTQLELDRRAAIEEPRTLEQAATEFADLDARFKALLSEEDDLKLAINVATSGNLHEAASIELMQRVRRFANFASRRPQQAQDRRRAIAIELEDLQPLIEIARERLRLARERRAVEVAATFRPRQRKAVQSIAAALEQLSRAVAAEIELHVEFQTVSPDPNLDLIDLGRPWHDALLGNPRSVASEWVRRAKAAGLLDG